MTSEVQQNTELYITRITAADALKDTYHCTEASALRSTKRHFTEESQDVEACEQEMKAKRCGPCLVGIDIYGGQRKYTQTVAAQFYPVTAKSFPFFAPEYRNITASTTLGLTWGDVARALNDNVSRQLRFLILQTDAEVQALTLEEQYIEMVLKEELYDPVAFMSFMDGTLPLIDYVTAREAGTSAEELDRQMRLSVGAQTRLPAVMPTYETSTTRAPPRRRIVLANSPTTSVPSRQDKWNAQRLLKAHGINYLRSIHAHTAMEAETQRVASGIPFPVVVKPVSGAGSEFVTVCHTASEFATAFSIAKGVHTTQNTEAAHMTIEEYIEGPEYVVNVVTYDGVSVVTDVWRSFKYPMPVHSHRLRSSDVRKMEEKRKADPTAPAPLEVDTTTILYDHQEFVSNLALLPPDSEARRAVDYTLKCVNALGMRNGASHCEVRVDARPNSPRRGQPVLIELNPRVLGDVPRATHLVGYDQVTLLFYLAAVAAALPEPAKTASQRRLKALPWPPVPVLYTSAPPSPSAEVAAVPSPRPTPSLSAPGEEHTIFIVFLTTSDDGVLCGPGVHYVSALPTFVRVARGTLFEVLGPNSIATVRRTTDLFSSPGACVFEGPRAAVERDVGKLRVVEGTSYVPELGLVCQEMIRIKSRLYTLRSRPSVPKHGHAKTAAPASAACGGLSYKYKQPSSSAEDSDATAAAALAEEVRQFNEERDTLTTLLAASKEECARVLKEQNPPPLYVPLTLFELLRSCEVAGHLHV